MNPVVIVDIIVKPKIASQKYSGGPNFKEIMARKGASVIKTIDPKKEPKDEEKAPATSACCAIPFFVNGCPSKVVAIAAGVPGVLIRHAGIESAYIAPTDRPPSIIRPASGGIVNVIGINIASPMVAVRPGRAPMIMPRNVPAKRESKLVNSNTLMNPFKVNSNIFDPSFSMFLLRLARLRCTSLNIIYFRNSSSIGL
jgi:hypothetical protein